MLGLAVFIALLIISSLAVKAFSFDRRANVTPAEQIRTELFDADQHLTSEFQRARKAMNEASGQTWRNLAG